MTWTNLYMVNSEWKDDLIPVRGLKPEIGIGIIALADVERRSNPR